MKKKKRIASAKETKRSSTSPSVQPAVPPPDDPLRRASEFDPDREFTSSEMAKKRLEAIEQTKRMPHSNEEPEGSESDPPSSK